MYSARKNTAAFKGNQYAVKSGGDQNELHQKSINPTAAAIAKDLGVGVATVKRAEKFANGLDALHNSPECPGRTNHPRTAIYTTRSVTAYNGL